MRERLMMYLIIYAARPGLRQIRNPLSSPSDRPVAYIHFQLLAASPPRLLLFPNQTRVFAMTRARLSAARAVA